MKLKSTYIALLCALAFVTHGLGQVPSLINYQGRLTNGEGNPISGERAFAISIYDAQENGSVLYSEDIGQVTLDQNGVYSFQFGGSGTSTSSASFLIGATDGTSQSFTRALPSQPINGSLGISDGTNTWSQASGPGNPPAIIGSYDSNTNIASVVYFQGVPEAGKLITVTYKTESAGITEALATATEHWMELSIEGVVQQTRQRVLAVPFAAVAGKVLGSSAATNPRNEKQISSWSAQRASQFGEFVKDESIPLPRQQSISGVLNTTGFTKLVAIKISGLHTSNTGEMGYIIFRLQGHTKFDSATLTRQYLDKNVRVDRGPAANDIGNGNRSEFIEDYVIPVDLDIQDIDNGLKVDLSWGGSGHTYNLENPIFIFE